MKAKYNPTNIDTIPESRLKAMGKEFDWVFAFEIEGVKWYETKDLKFPTTMAIPETDLVKIIDMKVEVVPNKETFKLEAEWIELEEAKEFHGVCKYLTTGNKCFISDITDIILCDGLLKTCEERVAR